MKKINESKRINKNSKRKVNKKNKQKNIKQKNIFLLFNNAYPPWLSDVSLFGQTKKDYKKNKE